VFIFGAVYHDDVDLVHQRERPDLGIGQSTTALVELLLAVVNVAGDNEHRHGNALDLPLLPRLDVLSPHVECSTDIFGGGGVAANLLLVDV
jgi:hypothetical protein